MNLLLSHHPRADMMVTNQPSARNTGCVVNNLPQLKVALCFRNWRKLVQEWTLFISALTRTEELTETGLRL